MTLADIEAFIIRHWKQRAQDKGLDLGVIGPSSDLLETSGSMDSLDLAVLVALLEEYTGRDPLAAGTAEFRTISDLARLYVE